MDLGPGPDPGANQDCVDPSALAALVEAVASADAGVLDFLQRGADGVGCVSESALTTIVDSAAPAAVDETLFDVGATLDDF